jgi:hypothetical protein
MASLIDGTVLKFTNWGIYNAQLMLKDRQTESVWQHCEPVAFHGELDGTVLPEAGTQLHTTWGKWKAWHPDTLVMSETTDPMHRDQRHGHGREEYFERRGIGWLEHQYFIGTMQNPPDERLPEQEAVYGVNEAEGVRAYPFRQVKHNGNVVNDDLNGLPVTIWSDPDPNAFTTVGYVRQAGDQLLDFELRDGQFVDSQTDSTWNLEGRAIAGQLEGEQLRQLRGYFLRWHGWSAPRPTTEVYRSPLDLPAESRWGFDEGVFAPILDALRTQLGLDVKVEEEIVTYGLPQGCERGVQVRIDGHRFWLYHTESVAHAKDLEVLPHDWEVKPHCTSHGRFVLKDEVEEQWTDWTHIVRLRDNQTAWSPLLSDDEFLRVFRDACQLAEPVLDEPEEPTMSQVFRALEGRGYLLEYNHWNSLVVSRSGLPPRCRFLVQFLLGVDRMLLYRFESDALAATYAERVGHALAAQNYVLRSTPVDMYMIAKFEAGQKPEEKTGWSQMLNNEKFCQDFQEVISELKEQCATVAAPGG